MNDNINIAIASQTIKVVCEQAPTTGTTETKESIELKLGAPDLTTTSKEIVGAINEVAANSGSSNTIDEHIDFKSVRALTITYLQNYKINSKATSSGVTCTITYDADNSPYTLGDTVTSGVRLRILTDIVGIVNLKGTLL